MLEAGSGRFAQSSLELLDQGPAVEGIKEVDISRGPTKNLEWQVAVLDVGGGRLLVRIAAITEGDVL
jgi:hypothetical protein